MRTPFSAIVIGAMSATLLAACGSDGGDAPAPGGGSTPPPAATQISGSNYLDAFAVGSLGGLRILAAAVMVDEAFNAVVEADDVSGTYPCAGGGSISFAKAAAANQRTISVSNCTSGDTVYASGSLVADNATSAQYGNLVLLQAGQFTFNNVVVRTVGYTDTETYNGTVTITRAGDLSLGARGGLSVIHNGRADAYTIASASSTPPDVNGAIDILSLSYGVNSPRFAQPLTVVLTADAWTVAAPDQSRVLAFDASSGTTLALRFEVRSSAGAQPSVMQILTATDPLLVAAFSRAYE